MTKRKTLKQQAGGASFERLKAELAKAFAAPDSAYSPLTAEDVIRRNKARAPS